MEASQIGSASERKVTLFIGGVFPKESLLPRACMISSLVPLWPETPSHSGQAYTCRAFLKEDGPPPGHHVVRT